MWPWDPYFRGELEARFGKADPRDWQLGWVGLAIVAVFLTAVAVGLISGLT